ncbi:hypothetical protein GCM10010885_16000 [Alicyclobacillus cellulosilyticus]|uniref:DUF4179 domain-containing protein n=1 Tax=Alicyclobacillus cellulosilyticus TaxID=1003997 RepID=A0A917KB55_9BACL|nr:DUF4179 domain-containing protein [Alicyclobacillus cellulosilyticus]GGJ07724.1 hypothetical protein GCM10010885_16000 [Alicyclobacillus cellulosilyticus]
MMQWLRRHYAQTAPDTRHIDFRRMAERAVASATTPAPGVTRGLPRQRDARFGHVRGERKGRRGMAWSGLAAAIMLCGLGYGALALSPNLDGLAYAALAGNPGLASMIPPFDAGLLRQVQNGAVHELDVSAAGHGVTVRVLGAYADSARIAVFVRTEGSGATAQDIWMIGDPVLTDQFGHRYRPLPIDGVYVGEHGPMQVTLNFEGIPRWKQWLGVRLRLSFHTLVDVPPKSYVRHTVSGNWSLSWLQPVAAQGTSPTAAPAGPSTPADVPVRLASIQCSPTVTLFTLAPRASSRAHPAFGGPYFGYVRSPSRGNLLLSLGGTPNEIAFPALPPGRYELVINGVGAQNGIERVHWVFPFVVH